MPPLAQFILAVVVMAWLSRFAVRAGAAAGLPVGLSTAICGLVQP